MLRHLLLTASLLSSPVWANASGAIGYSGAPGTGSCNDCHSGGAAPSVSITGPDTLPAGGTGNYTVTVSGGTRVGVNVALTDMLAALNPMSGNLGLAFRELHQMSPQPSGTAFQFTLSAPPTAGPLTLYAAGNATNGNNATSGDRSANGTKTVTIMMGSGAADPVISTPAAAMQSPLRAKTTTVTVGAADDGGPTNLTYIWSATGPGPVVFTPNSSNAATTSQASFARGGDYMIKVTVRDSLNHTKESSFMLTVESTFSNLRLTPYAVQLAPNAKQQFTAVAKDQFEVLLAPQPAIIYEIPMGVGGGTITVTGLLTAQAGIGGPFVVTARTMGITTSSTFTVGKALPMSGDVDGPHVQLTAPMSGLPLTNGEVFEATATDDIGIEKSGVEKVTFTIADIPVAEATSAPWRVTYMTLAGLPGGKQALAAVAKDFAGNETKSSSVVVDVPPPMTGGGAGGGGGGTGGAAGAAGGGTGGGSDGGCACGTTDVFSATFTLLTALAMILARRRRHA